MQKVQNYIGQNILALLALLVSLVTAYATYQQQVKFNRIETGYFRFVEAQIVTDQPAVQLPIDKFDSSVSFAQPNRMFDPAAVIAVWVEIKVTNTGFRTFSIDSVNSGLATDPDGGASVADDFGYPNLDKNFESPSGAKLVTFPKPVASGEQARFYRQVIFPVAPGEAARLKTSKALLDSPTSLIINSLIEYGLADPLEMSSDSHMIVLISFAEPLERFSEPNFAVTNVTFY